MIPQPEDTLRRDAIEELMFDDSFRRSKHYFELLQVLRIFTDLVDETRRNLDEVGRYFVDSNKASSFLSPLDAPRRDREFRALKANWDVITRFHNEAEKLLLQRIAAKIDEIKSLRDGVSSNPLIAWILNDKPFGSCSMPQLCLKHRGQLR